MRRRSSLTAVALMVWNGTNGRIAWTALLALLTALTEGISITMLIPIVAAASPETADQAAQIPVIGDALAQTGFALSTLLLIFVLLISLQAILVYTKNYYSMRLMQALSDRLKRSLLRALSAARWDAIAKRRLSDVNQVLTGSIPRSMTAANALLALVQASILIVIYVALAAFVSWPMALFAVLVGSVLYAAMYPLRRNASRHGQELTGLFERQSHVTLDFLNGVRLAKTFVAEGGFLRSFDAHLRTIREATLRFYALSSLGAMVFQVGVAMVAAGFVYLAITSFGLGLGELAVLLVIFARLTPRFGAIQEQGQQFLANAPAYLHFEEMVGYFAEAREPDETEGAQAPHLRQAITLADITMRYSPDASPSLDKVSARIAAGRITALVGPSGSGKSTLADIVCGLVNPTSGTMHVDATPIDAVNLRSWRSRVATVPQDAFLFDMSLRENMMLAKPDATEKELWAALERAQIDRFVRSLPEGLDTQVGNRGARFSGGECQRFAIARALLPQPEILILDEATSALDLDNQGKLAEMIAHLRDQGLTILLIAHQPLLVETADDRIVLEDGRVAAGKSA